MRKGRYVYSYSPRRIVPATHRRRGWALGLATATALMLVAVWVARGGVSLSSGSTAQESRSTATTAGWTSEGSGPQSSRLQGGGDVEAGRFGKDSAPPAVTAPAA